jgi:hypothetical protein
MSFASICEAPWERIVSSTFCASTARSESVTGRPWHAFFTPEHDLLAAERLDDAAALDHREAGGLGGGEASAALGALPATPLIESPSSLVRESMTRESG